MRESQRWKVLALGAAAYVLLPQLVLITSGHSGFLRWFALPSIVWIVPMLMVLYQIRSGGSFGQPFTRIRTTVALLTAAVILWRGLDLMHTSAAHLLFAPQEYFTMVDLMPASLALPVTLAYNVLAVMLVWYAPNTAQNRRVHGRFRVSVLAMAFNVAVAAAMVAWTGIDVLYPTFYVFLPLAALVVLDAPWWPRVGRWWEERRAAS